MDFSQNVSFRRKLHSLLNPTLRGIRFRGISLDNVAVSYLLPYLGIRSHYQLPVPFVVVYHWKIFDGMVSYCFLRPYAVDQIILVRPPLVAISHSKGKSVPKVQCAKRAKVCVYRSILRRRVGDTDRSHLPEKVPK